MKLCYWNGVDRISNFGDVLNPYIYNSLLPATFDDDVKSIFIGIGTLLEVGMGEKLNIPIEFLERGEPKSNNIIVFGGGAGYSKPPAMDARWKIYSVRGPLSANLLKLDAKYAVVDPAILVRRIYKNEGGKVYKYSLMPHHSSASPMLRKICNQAGINYIDPLDAIDVILKEISSTELLLTEALHGSIVADALRTPWVPIQTRSSIFSFKWEDWCASVGLKYQPVLTSDILNMIWESPSEISLLSGIKNKIKYSLAERNIRNIALDSEPFLSKDSVIEDLTQELEMRLKIFKVDVSNGVFL